MRTFRKNPKRVLAIDACARGFGFAVVEGSDRLIDWGVKEVHRGKNSKSLALIKKLIEYYEPDLVVVEDCTARGSRRRRRIRNLIQKLLTLCSATRMRTRSVPRLRVRKIFGASNKDEVAATIVQNFPELAPCQPRPRKAKHDFTEDSRMSIFDAVALALTVLPGQVRESQPEITEAADVQEPNHDIKFIVGNLP